MRTLEYLILIVSYHQISSQRQIKVYQIVSWVKSVEVNDARGASRGGGGGLSLKDYRLPNVLTERRR